MGNGNKGGADTFNDGASNTTVDLGEELIVLGLARTTLLPLSLCVLPILCSIVVPYQFNFVFVTRRLMPGSEL